MPERPPLIGTIFISHPWALVVLLAVVAGYVVYTTKRR
jgi:hypothetical protein